MAKGDFIYPGDLYMQHCTGVQTIYPLTECLLSYNYGHLNCGLEYHLFILLQFLQLLTNLQ